MNYVEQYLRASEGEGRAEQKIEEYTQRVSENRWAQCRIAYEAITSGEYNRTSFAKAVDRSTTHIGRQVRLWEKHGKVMSGYEEYSDAYAKITGAVSAEAENKRTRESHARAALAEWVGAGEEDA